MSTSPQLPAPVNTIPGALSYWAARVPDAPALIVPGGRTLTYETLWRDAGHLASSLSQCGIGRHDRVVLLLPDGPALANALLGTMCAAVAVPLPAALPAPALRAALHGLNSAAALVAPGAAAATRACCAEHGLAVFVLHDGGADGAPRLAAEARSVRQATHPARPDPGDAAIVRQTSGTTGAPKRVSRTHGEMIAFGRVHRDLFRLGVGDRAPAIAPMTLTLGQTVLMHGIVAGAALICPPPSDLGQMWEVIARENPTWMSVSAGFLELLARYLVDCPPSRHESSLRFVQVTSAAISPAVCDALASQLGAPILPRYSSSEAGGIALTLPPPAPAKPGSVGQPIQEVRIVGATEQPVGPGTAGEIWVRGPKVASGYLDDPAATAAAFLPGGWYRTGDVGYLDEDGFLFLTGRVNELINRGGSKIAPLEIDAALLAHPAVRDAAAFAVPDERLGEDIAAAVVLERGYDTTPRALRRWLLDRLAPHKVPRRIWFLAALPRTSTGKVQRGVLAEDFTFKHRS